VHHLALVVGVFDGDVVVPGEVLAVGAEEAVGDVAEDDVGPVPRPDGLPHDGGLLVVFVQALDDDLPAVAERGRLVRGGEVAAVGGAVEEDAGAAVVVDPVHPPRRVQRRALRAQGHAHPVLVRVEVHAAHAVPQADVHAVGELLHRGRALVGGRAATAGESVASRCGLGGAGKEKSGAEQSRCLPPRLAISRRRSLPLFRLMASVGQLLRMPPVNWTVGSSLGGPSRIDLGSGATGTRPRDRRKGKPQTGSASLGAFRSSVRRLVSSPDGS
jgi:hypothetical protein